LLDLLIQTNESTITEETPNQSNLSKEIRKFEFSQIATNSIEKNQYYKTRPVHEIAQSQD